MQCFLSEIYKRASLHVQTKQNFDLVNESNRKIAIEQHHYSTNK